MMRCPDCNKFASFDTDVDPEVDLDVDSEGAVSGTARIANNCAECGTELKSAEMDIEVNLSEEVKVHRAAHADKPEDHDALTVDATNVTRVEELMTKDRNGKTITNRRYQKQLYGVELTVVVSCSCGEEFTEDVKETVEASSMEEMV